MRRTSCRVDAIRSHASAELTEASQSLARRRQRLSHAKVRSMTQRRATITKPFASSGRLTISIVGPSIFRSAFSKLFARVTAVSKQVCNSRVARTRQSDDGRRAVPILNIGWVHDGAQQISLCIGNDVALATFDPLAGIKAAWPSALGRLDRLTVDDRRRWLRLPSSKPPRDFNQGFISVHEGKTLLYRASKRDCYVCPLKPQCCPKEPSRKIPRDVHEHARDVARSFAGTEGFEQSRHERKKIEMRFAHLKRILRLGRLRLRGPRGAQDEFVLAAIAQNLRRLASLVARPPPAEALCIA